MNCCWWRRRNSIKLHSQNKCHSESLWMINRSRFLKGSDLKRKRCSMALRRSFRSFQSGTCWRTRRCARWNIFFLNKGMNRWISSVLWTWVTWVGIGSQICWNNQRKLGTHIWLYRWLVTSFSHVPSSWEDLIPSQSQRYKNDSN